MQDLTTAQVIFVSQAGMEDAQITAGNGLVKRDAAMTSNKTVDDLMEENRNYFAAQKARRQGTVEFKELQEKRKKQSVLRKLLEAKASTLVQEDLRYR
jgi:hypothetical protein